MKHLCLDLQSLDHFFPTNQVIVKLQINGPWNRTYNGSQIYVKSSVELLKTPAIISDLYVYCLYATFPWSQLSVMLQHFRILNQLFPFPVSNEDVSEDLTRRSQQKGLRLELPNYDEDIKNQEEIKYNETCKNISNVIRNNNINSTDTTSEQGQIEIVSIKQTLSPLPGMETVNSLVLGKGVYDIVKRIVGISFPSVLEHYLWPELLYIELETSYIEPRQIFALQRTTPKLKYMKIKVSPNHIPDVVWTVDWESLPWKTGFIAACMHCPTRVAIHLRGKISFKEIPVIKIFLFGIWEQWFNMEVDMSQNELMSLGNIQFTIVLGNMGTTLFTSQVVFNLSHNRLKKLSLFSRFGMNNVVSIRVLDLSFNQLQGHDSDFLRLEDLTELYLSHNNYTELPYYYTQRSRYSIRSLKQLKILDLSHNLIEYEYEWYYRFTGPLDGLGYDDYSSIRKLYLSNNHIHVIPKNVYSSTFLTYIDLSENGIIKWPFVYIEDMNRISQHDVHTAVNLSFNGISEVWPKFYSNDKIPIAKILQNYDIYLDGNPINCSCETHKLYKYLLSSSRSQKPELDRESLPDFSFYENQWKCMYPSYWAGIPLMQISEYEYDITCGENLMQCADECFCHHSWKLDDAVVANCSHGSTHALSALPEKLPNHTSHLILSHNNIEMLCHTHSYLNNISLLDLSWNKIYKICSNVLIEMVDLKHLILTNNMIQDIDLDLQLSSLSILFLDNNVLEKLPNSIQNIQNLETIRITGNKLRCDCDTYWMTAWLITSISIVEDPYSLICFSGKGRGKRLIDLHQDDVGCYDPLIYALVGLGVAFVLIGILVTVIYRYRGYIKVWLYARFGFHPWDRVKENPQLKDYDAFVAYCRKDVGWVLKTLLPYLEAPQCGYHLCVHDRDFVPGVAITKNIMTAIEYSRRTILVLTPDFLKSGWCDLEFQAAHERTLNDRSNYLIVVLLKEVEVKDLDETLKLYMKTNTYVCVDDNWFWRKMLYAMPKVPIDKLKVQQNNIIELPNILEQPMEGIELNNMQVDVEIELNNMQVDVVAPPEHNNDDVSSSDSDISSESDVEVAPGIVYKRQPRRNVVAKLPPLFRRIHTYNQLKEVTVEAHQALLEEDPQVHLEEEDHLDLLEDRDHQA